MDWGSGQPLAPGGVGKKRVTSGKHALWSEVGRHAGCPGWNLVWISMSWLRIGRCSMTSGLWSLGSVVGPVSSSLSARPLSERARDGRVAARRVLAAGFGQGAAHPAARSAAARCAVVSAVAGVAGARLPVGPFGRQRSLGAGNPAAPGDGFRGAAGRREGGRDSRQARRPGGEVDRPAGGVVDRQGGMCQRAHSRVFKRSQPPRS